MFLPEAVYHRTRECPICWLQIFVEIERARLTQRLANIKEAEGNVSEAAEILQEVAVVRAFFLHMLLKHSEQVRHTRAHTQTALCSAHCLRVTLRLWPFSRQRGLEGNKKVPAQVDQRRVAPHPCCFLNPWLGKCPKSSTPPAITVPPNAIICLGRLFICDIWVREDEGRRVERCWEQAPAPRDYYQEG
eukprot:scaffold108844_cov16-Tisochrysis_lutea.AAC.1